MSPIIQIQKKNVCIYFGVFVILPLVLCIYKLGYQAEQA